MHQNTFFFFGLRSASLEHYDGCGICLNDIAARWGICFQAYANACVSVRLCFIQLCHMQMTIAPQVYTIRHVLSGLCTIGDDCQPYPLESCRVLG